jgi:iron complex outermembrane receptor protein
VTGSYSLFSYAPEFHAPAIDFGTDGGATPRHQAQVRYSVELPRRVDADVALFAAGAMPEPAFEVPAHARVDARLAWRPAAPVELSLVMQNLLGQEHPEMAGWSSGVMQPSRLRRSAYGSVSWTF